jgi:hypothetical protein
MVVNHYLSVIGMDDRLGLYLSSVKLMRIRLCLICLLVTLPTACGLDLNPQKYLVKSILLRSYEEYSFQYLGGKLHKLSGTDSISLNYTYHKDSTSILHLDKSGKLFQRTRLSYLNNQLAKVKIDWQFAKVWYKDSILFNYSGSNLSSINYKRLSYQVGMQEGNLASIRRGTGSLSTSYTLTFDQVTNPLASVYWLHGFIVPSGSTALLQPKDIVRYFSKNNISTATDVILGSTTVERYSYTYLHGILPKSINLEIETAKDKVSNLVYLFDIVYTPKESLNSSP